MNIVNIKKNKIFISRPRWAFENRGGIFKAKFLEAPRNWTFDPGTFLSPFHVSFFYSFVDNL